MKFYKGKAKKARIQLICCLHVLSEVDVDRNDPIMLHECYEGEGIDTNEAMENLVKEIMEQVNYHRNLLKEEDEAIEKLIKGE